MSVIGSNILAGASGQAVGYNVERSLRFNSSDSGFCSRTPTSAGNRRTWTWAGWVKKSDLGGTRRFFIAGVGGAAGGIQFESDSLLAFDFPGSLVWSVQTSAVFSDPSAWYHILLALDTTQATSSNRVKLYVNGVQQTAVTATYPSPNYEGYINSGSTLHAISSLAGVQDFFNGYLADIHFIDGQALDPTSFTEVSATTGQLIPKAYTGTFGTNGFWLKFSDNSNNTAATLGKDYSPNGNNWTPNNLSVTAGAGNDSLVDTPTSYGTDTGTGAEVRGNYASWSPLYGATPTLSNGNLEASVNSTTAYSSISVTSGKWYWEITPTGTVSTNTYIGIIDSTYIKTDSSWSSQARCYVSNANKYDGSTSSYGASYTANDVIGVALDVDAGTLVFYKNGTSQGTAFNTGLTGKEWKALAYSGNSATHIANFGQRAFAYTAPSGFKALVDTNLTAPVIAKGSSAFDVKLYTGNGSTQTISGLSFSPDLVWIKERNAAADHALYDSVRGVQQQLESNTTTDETTESTGLTAFNSDGFALSSLAQVNTNTDTYVAWCWDESATAGFDIVTYTGNGSARTISHGLGVAPNMIIVKARTTASTDQGWPVYHSANTAAPATDYLLLNSTAATADLDTVWNDTAPTSSVFSVGTNALVNTNNDTYVAYLFSAVAGYSSFGSYTGNGSTDGPFVYLGFRPAVVIVKMSSSTGNWTILDDKREGYNVDNDPLFPNLSNAEGTTDLIDITSNGFKVRTTDATFNTNAGTYVYAAWASSPFAYSRAR